jgi:hypothetical protein
VICFEPDLQVGPVLFRIYTDKILEHAVALKRYNGLGSISPIDYFVFNTNSGMYDFHPWAYYYRKSGNNNILDSNNYVASICAAVN